MTTHESLSYFCDATLSRRIEVSGANGCAYCAQAVAQLSPEIGACSIRVAGGVAAFAGVDSPLTQAFGLGFDGEVSGDDLDELEAFFHDRGAAADVEASPLADPSLFTLFGERGYRPVEHSNVLVRPLSLSAPLVAPGRLVVREARPDEEDAFTWAISRGFTDSDEDAQAIRCIARASFHASDTRCFVALLDDEVVACGTLAMGKGIAGFAGAATLERFRRMGAQGALYAARLRYAAEHGCDVATVSTLPGSGSQRNAERGGFRVAYTRTKWRLAAR